MKEKKNFLDIVRNNPDMGERLHEQAGKVQEDINRLRNASLKYNNKYHDKVVEGTQKMQMLLEDGKNKGYDEVEVRKKHGEFIPTVYTPNLNFLHFLMNEHEDNEDERKQLNEKYGHLTHSGGDMEEFNPETEFFNKFQSFDEHLYGNVNHETFKKLKKLKTLSQSENEHEAFNAYRKCMELCRKYQLNFNQIPTYK